MSYRVSEKSYSLSEISRMNRSWPIPCAVQDGFYGETAWNTVSSGETILLVAVQKRRRVLVLSSDQKHYSIPYDYPLKFSVVLPDSKDTSPKPISDILSAFKPPVTLRLQKSDSTQHFIRDRRDCKRSLRFDKLVVVLTYDEMYLVGNCINNGVLQKEPILLPAFLKVRLRLIGGCQATAEKDWMAIMEAWKTESRKSLLHPIQPPVDIVVFESLPSEIESTKQTPKNNDIYETLEPNAYVTFKLGQANEYTKLAEVKSTTTKHVVNADKTSASPQRKSSSHETDLQSDLRKELATRKLQSSSYPVTSTTEKPDKVLPTGKTIEAREPLLPPRLPKPHSSQPRKPPPPNTDATATTTTAAAATPITTTTTTAAAAAITTAITKETHFVPKKTPLHDVNGDEPPRDYWTSADLGQPRARLRSMKDVPATVDSLNCDEIVDCLRLLEMSMYAERFQENQIDGSLLIQLDESILTEELMLTSLHAKKLMMFAKRGWRPT